MQKLSASQLKLYRECRIQYFDRYVRRIPQTTQDSSGLWGTALHKGIESYYQGGKPALVFQRYLTTELARLQDLGTPVNYRMTYAEMIEKGRAILESLPLTQFQPLSINGQAALEIAFDLPFYDICTMRGFVDMVAKDVNDNVIIVDWKSSGRKPTKAALNDDPQFLLYAWVFYQQFGVLPDGVYWYHLRTNDSMAMSLDNFWTRFDRVIETAREVVNDPFDDIDVADRCARCPEWCNRHALL